MKIRQLCLSALFLLATAAYAENAAPVYDVDSMSTDGSANLQQESIVKMTPGSAMINSASATREPRATKEQTTLQAELQNRINNMQGEIQNLRGQVEELMHQVQVLNSQQELMRGDVQPKQHANKNPVEPSISPVPRDLDEDASAVPPKQTAKTKPLSEKNNTSARLVAAAKPVAKKTNSQPNDAEEQAAYQTAYNFIKAKKYDEAIGTLHKMLLKYPSGQFAANAHYWLGELYSLTGENTQAASEFNTVIKSFPTSTKVADSELKLGLIYASQLKWPEAKTTFKKVVAQYPGTATAQLANEQLKLLKQAGH